MSTLTDERREETDSRRAYWGGEENMGTGGSAIGGVFSALFGIVWLGIVIYMISLAIRFVRAVEKIADKIK